jgi:hypothetical protein
MEGTGCPCRSLKSRLIREETLSSPAFSGVSRVFESVSAFASSLFSMNWGDRRVSSGGDKSAPEVTWEGCWRCWVPSGEDEFEFARGDAWLSVGREGGSKRWEVPFGEGGFEFAGEDAPPSVNREGGSKRWGVPFGEGGFEFAGEDAASFSSVCR